MSNLDPRRRLPLLALAAAFASLATFVCAQASQQPDSPQAATQQPAPIIIQAPPLPPPTPEEIADSYRAHKRYQKAIEAYKQAIQATENSERRHNHPNSEEKHLLATLWNKLGISYQMMFNTDEATRCYRESLKLNSKDFNVLNNLATIYDAQKDYGQARRMYHKALKINPKSAVVYKNLGTNLLADHKYKEGWRAYQQALALDPNIFGHDTRPRVENPASLEQRGAMNFYMAKGCVKAGMPERAIEYLRMALNEGFTTPRKIAKDNEFAALRDIPAFKRLIAEEKPH